MRLSRLREHFADAFSAYPQVPPVHCQAHLQKSHTAYPLHLKPLQEHAASTSGDPGSAKQEIAYKYEKKNQYDLDSDGVLDERELELAMEKEAKSTWQQANSLFSTHPSTFKRILLLREIEQEMDSGNYSSMTKSTATFNPPFFG